MSDSTLPTGAWPVMLTPFNENRSIDWDALDAYTDWLIELGSAGLFAVGDQQGLVRRISVRATEIETFDRASLIVPNSELITGRVLNWTHRDSLGAVNVKVGVGYDSDPEQVIAILKKCADDHRDVLRTPAPSAFFENFGDSALMFNLRISLPDIAKAGSVQSDLRVAIFKALRAANIEIPFNQLDVNLRDLDGVRRYLASTYRSEPAKPADEPGDAAASNGKRVAGE